MRKTTLAPVIAVTCLILSVGARAAEWKPAPLDHDTEITEALAAGPESIREGAGVYVLTTSGYALARQSRNGFHCIVGRSQPDSFEPQCFDAEGSATLLAQLLLRGELQMQGLAPDEIRRTLDEAWANGRLRAPSRPGVNYMLSAKNRVPVGPDRVIPYAPHLMFYAPYLRDSDVGGDRTGASSPVFMINEGEPSGYVIVPVDPAP